MTLLRDTFTELLEPQYPLESQFTYSTDQFTENGIRYHSNTEDHQKEWIGVLCNAANIFPTCTIRRFMYFTDPYIHLLQT